jgi:molybdate transport system permease protein
VTTFFLGIVAARLVLKLNRLKGLADGLFTLPLVLPPTVVGFFLLLLFGKNGLFGQTLAALGWSLVFTWQGAVIAATVVSFPLMYRAARGAFEQMDENLIYAARTLGASESWIFLRVMLPVCWPGVAAGTILAFARALGEFGATTMLAGNIPGRTQTMSLAVYTAVSNNNRTVAYKWVLVIMVISFLSIYLMNRWSGYRGKAGRGGGL